SQRPLRNPPALVIEISGRPVARSDFIMGRPLALVGALSHTLYHNATECNVITFGAATQCQRKRDGSTAGGETRMQRWGCVLVAQMLAFAGSDTAHALEVVASIKPVHSLVAAVMEGAGEPALIVEGASSPHAYSMRPSQAAALETADVVFWIGPGLEAFLNEPLETLASNATIVSLTAAPGLTKLPLREGGAFEPHSDEEHDRADEVRDDGEDRHEEEGSQHAEFEEHAHANIDMHLWLDPENARAM